MRWSISGGGAGNCWCAPSWNRDWRRVTWIRESPASACRCTAGCGATLRCCARRWAASWSAACCSVRWERSSAEPGICWCWTVGLPPLPDTPRILFVPVSGTFGMGEYARSLAIARAASRRWQGAAIHFVLSREAPYAAGAPFPSTLLASSPTFHTAAVVELLGTWRPDVVIFDNAGRTAQLRAARALGARIVYISARRRQRRKAFRWRWMRLIDEHLIAYPQVIAGLFGFFEKLTPKMAGRPAVRYLDVTLSPADPEQRGAVPSRAGFDAGTYVPVVPGGRTGH